MSKDGQFLVLGKNRKVEISLHSFDGGNMIGVAYKKDGLSRVVSFRMPEDVIVKIRRDLNG